jgi:hypothetical protein
LIGPDWETTQDGRHLCRLAYRHTPNLLQLVPGPQSSPVASTAGLDKQGDHGILPIHPSDPIIGQMKETLLAEIDDGATHCRYCQNEQ